MKYEAAARIRKRRAPFDRGRRHSQIAATASDVTAPVVENKKATSAFISQTRRSAVFGRLLLAAVAARPVARWLVTPGSIASRAFARWFVTPRAIPTRPVARRLAAPA